MSNAAQPYTPEELEQVRQRAAKATPGPWFHRQAGQHRPSDPKQRYDWIGDHPDQGKHKKVVVGRDACYGGEPDYAFIAHAREDIPRLLVTLVERDATIDWLRNLRATDEMDRQAAEIKSLRAQLAQAHNAALELAAEVAITYLYGHEAAQAIRALMTKEQGEMMTELEKAARALRGVTHNLWLAVLCGNPNGQQLAIYKRMQNPQVGDLVSGMTTTFLGPNSGLRGVGYLEEMTIEPFPMEEPWDEELEGKPAPTEQVWYIRTFEGERLRWTNEQFLVCLTERFKS